MRENKFHEKLVIGAFKVLNRIAPWHKLPRFLGVFNLLAYRYEYNAKNLEDTYPSPDYQGKPDDPKMEDTTYLSARNSDGLYNDLKQPKMGCVGMRFGRNVPRHCTKPPTHEELMTPNPRIISEKLLARDKFKPATIVNLLAAAWIQFQTHDWFQHENSKTESHEVPLSKGDKWADSEMKIPKTQPDTPLNDTDRMYPAYKNKNTHWWDGSQIYGSSEAQTKQLRGNSDWGKLTVDVERCETFLPRDANGIPITGFNSNWWLGLELLHTVFVLEHNAICDELHEHNPTWTSEKIFDTARLINCALMAKIHTVEWTPAILANKTQNIGQRANWWGLMTEKYRKLLGQISTSEVIAGIPGSGVDHESVPFSLTEEFIAVYRLHPLIPDSIALFDAQTGAHKASPSIRDVAFERARDPLLKEGLTFSDALYSFGVNYPGAVTLHNTPNFLRDLHTPDGLHLDMAVVDILRDRERGVPRYNAFRRAFHMRPAKDFLDLTGGDAQKAEEVSAVYGGDIEKVDLLVGCLCEPLPEGFGFSDTAFRVFILMASRRLKSDRFIAGAFGEEEVYSERGVRWVQEGTMKEVLGRHFPELGVVLRGVGNAFQPWGKVGVTGEYKGVETNA